MPMGLALGGPTPILVVYATRCGSTEEVARAIAKDLEGRGFAVQVQKADARVRANGFHGVVVGSAVRYGGWLAEAKEFVRANQAALKGTRTAFFSVHGMNTGDDEKSRQGRAGYVATIHQMVTPGAEAFFAGKMDQSKLGFGERMIIKVMKGRNRDDRNWAAIHGWAKGLFS